MLETTDMNGPSFTILSPSEPEKGTEFFTLCKHSAQQNACTGSLLMRCDMKYCKTGWLGRELSIRAKIQETQSKAGMWDVGGQ